MARHGLCPPWRLVQHLSRVPSRYGSGVARWLLMCHYWVEGHEIALAHEVMGMVISVPRSGVTVTLHSLEDAGLIRWTRGMVTIHDREKLTEIADDASGVPERRYRELIGSFGKSLPQPANQS